VSSFNPSRINHKDTMAVHSAPKRAEMMQIKFSF